MRTYIVFFIVVLLLEANGCLLQLCVWVDFGFVGDQWLCFVAGAIGRPDASGQSRLLLQWMRGLLLLMLTI